MTTVEILDERIEQLKLEGVVDIRTFPCSTPLTSEELARSTLALIDAPTVVDMELF